MRFITTRGNLNLVFEGFFFFFHSVARLVLIVQKSLPVFVSAVTQYTDRWSQYL